MITDFIAGPNWGIAGPGIGILLLVFAGLAGLYFGFQRLVDGEPLPALGLGVVGLVLLIGAWFGGLAFIHSLLYPTGA